MNLLEDSFKRVLSKMGWEGSLVNIFCITAKDGSERRGKITSRKNVGSSIKLDRQLNAQSFELREPKFEAKKMEENSKKNRNAHRKLKEAVTFRTVCSTL